MGWAEEAGAQALLVQETQVAEGSTPGLSAWLRRLRFASTILPARRTENGAVKWGLTVLTKENVPQIE
eukprot:1060002-Alexandrium_andersonii.AAC.1